MCLRGEQMVVADSLHEKVPVQNFGEQKHLIQKGKASPIGWTVDPTSKDEFENQ